jgi:hypothetical protein
MTHRTSTKELDGVLLHNRAGSLNLIAGRKLNPRCNRVLSLKTIKHPIHRCYDPLDAVREPPVLGTVMANAYGRFITLPYRQPSTYDLACAVITLLNCIIPSDMVNAEGRLVAACLNAGFRLRYTRLENDAAVVANLDDEGTRFLATFSGEARRNLYLHHRDQQILMMGTVLLTLTKQVTPEGYDGWMANRVRAFSGTLGLPPDYNCWTTEQYPRQHSIAFSLLILSSEGTYSQYACLHR